ncbi:MAG TPA: hypothetical protein DCG49_05835 [Ruminococcus sp.]|nr:hypothetical protein [Ruminococcus sp.]
MKHAKSIVFVVLVSLILAAPTACLLLPQFRNADTSASENRTLTAFPAFKNEDGTRNSDFLSQAETWFSEHFAFRTELVGLYSSLTRHLFATSSEPDVIIGKDDWLYYAETVSDVTGVRTLDDTEIKHMAHSLAMIQKYCEENGAAFLFAPAPNKGSIYPEYLPARYMHSGKENNLDALYEALQSNGVFVCDWRAVLQEGKAQRQLYHKLDTHWNGDGAMLAYQALMDAANLDDLGFADYPRSETNDWNGDLWGMLAPDQENPDANAVYAVPQTYQTVGRMRSIDDITINTVCPTQTGSLLMFRDSFGRALIPLLSERFAACTYSRATDVPLQNIAQIHTDLVVYELVERNLRNLLIYAPVMPAPQCETPIISDPQGDAEAFLMQSANDGTYLHCYGYYDPAFAENDAIICTFSDGNTQQSYEAFPCFESEKLETEQPEGNGFSLRVPLTALPQQGTLTVSVIRNGQTSTVGTAPFTAS